MNGHTGRGLSTGHLHAVENEYSTTPGMKDWIPSNLYPTTTHDL
jgi:hypothetical protein